MTLNKYFIQRKEFKIDKVSFVKLVFKHDYQKSKNIIFFIHRWALSQKEEEDINKQIELIDSNIYPNIFILRQKLVLPKESLGENIFEIPEALNIIIEVSNFKERELQILSLFSLFLMNFEKASFSLDDLKKVKKYSRKEFSLEEIVTFLKKCPLVLNKNENYTFVDYHFENYFSALEFNKFEKTNYTGEYPKIRNFNQINQYLLIEAKKPIEMEKRFDEYLKIKRAMEKLVLDQLYEDAANRRDYSIKFFNKNIISYWSEMNLNNWKKNEL